MTPDEKRPVSFKKASLARVLRKTQALTRNEGVEQNVAKAADDLKPVHTWLRS